MKGTTGFIVGVGVGYALAVKLGRVDPLSVEPESPPLDQPVTENAEPVGKAQELLGRGLRAASSALRR